MSVTRIPFDVSLEKATALSAGSLTCLYEKGNLRYIKKGHNELVRMIYTAVRDGDWNTASYTIHDEHIVNDGAGFRVSYTAKYALNDIAYSAAITITGSRDEQIVFEMNGVAEKDFNTNRIGICVHLPVKECAGQRVLITEPTGIETNNQFPALISPGQPFGNIKKMQWLTGDDEITLLCDGEIFEAEDQRNWMDESFKVYGRPLALPFPYAVNRGDEVHQKITITVKQKEQSVHQQNDDSTPSIEKYALPAFGVDAGNIAHAATDYDELKLLYSDKVRLELFFKNGWEPLLQKALGEIERSGKKVELAIFFTNNYKKELIEISDFLTSHNNILDSVLLLHEDHKVTPAFLQEAAWPLLKEKNPSIKIGYGTDVYFAELNRNRPVDDMYDFISFSMNPQVHSFDNRSLVENIGSIESMMNTVRSFTSKPVHVSPVTFKKRKNHDTTGQERNKPVNNFDERQHTGFGAGWFLLCFYALRKADSVTFFNLSGPAKIEPGSSLQKVLKQLNDFKPTAYYKNPGDDARIIFENDQGMTMGFDLDEAFFNTTKL